MVTTTTLAHKRYCSKKRSGATLIHMLNMKGGSHNADISNVIARLLTSFQEVAHKVYKRVCLPPNVCVPAHVG